MTVKARTLIAAAALTATGSLSVAIVLAGGAASATAAPVAPATFAAEVQAAPVVVVPAKAAPAARALAAHAPAPATRPKAPRAVRHLTIAAPVRKPALPVAAPKPAVKPVTTTTAPAPAPKPAPTTTTTSVRDDYPFRTATTNDSDTWGFTKRQCVSFAAFRLSQHGHTIDNATQNWGSALTWDDAATRLGKTVTTSPKVGAIAQWNANESSAVFSSTGSKAGTFTAGSYGHVGYVAAVYGDGSVLVEQYNLGGDRSYSAMRMSAPRYIVF